MNLGKSRDELVENGRLAYEWAREHMPALALSEGYVRKNIGKNNPLSGLKIAACLHVSKETSVLAMSLLSLGADLTLVSANPLSSQPGIAAFLLSEGIDVRARRGETASEYEEAIVKVAESSPEMIIDDGGELHLAYFRTRFDSCLGGTDETTSGTTRLEALASRGKLRYPVIAINEARTKHLFDNKYGSGQSAVDGFMRATGLLISGKTVVVSGYGWVGSGVAMRMRGLGAKVIVTEVDAVKALQAHLDGFEVMRMGDAASVGDVFLTCTGQIGVLTKREFLAMKNGAFLANVGHFDREIDVRTLFRIGERIEQAKEGIARIRIAQDKSLYLINQGRVINLTSAEGHPPEIMQLSFANQLLSLFYLAKNRSKLRNEVMKVPQEIDNMVAKFALQAFDLEIDHLNKSQTRYASSITRS